MIAKPLPKTNAPAFKKKSVTVQSTVPEATPWRPVSSGPNPMKKAVEDHLDRNAGGFRTITARTPLRSNNQTISDPVQTVVTATQANRSQRNRSLPIVFWESR